MLVEIFFASPFRADISLTAAAMGLNPFCTQGMQLAELLGVLMPIRSLLSIRMGERRIKISELSRQTGISRGTLTRIYNDDMDRIDLEILARLCEQLHCEVSDLLVFTPDANRQP